MQSLETLGKLSQCLSMVRGILEKLPGIKAELVANQVGWQDWGFTEFTPYIHSFSKESSGSKGCVYCDDKHRRSHECKKVVTPADRRQKLQAKKYYVSIVLVPDTMPPSIEADSPLFTARRNIIRLFAKPLRNHLTTNPPGRTH